MRHSRFGYHELSWYRRVLCWLRSHSGTWQYEANTACTQIRVCEVCGQIETRVRHAWDAGWERAGEIRTCTRCGKTETRGEQKQIDDLCDALNALGVEATISKRPWNVKELLGVIDVIDIPRSPIRCVEVRMLRDYEGVTYWTEYVVPDSRHIPEVSFRSMRVRTFPIFGRVIDVRWKGDDRGTGAIGRLTADLELNAAIVSAGAEIEVGSSPTRGWFITHLSTDAPSAGVFACYEKVARDLSQTKQIVGDTR